MSCRQRWVSGLLLAALSSVCAADEPGVPALPVASFLATDVQPSPKAKLPQGWTLKPAAEPVAGSAAARLIESVRQTLQQAGLDASQVPILASELAGPQKASAVVAVLGGDQPPTGASEVDVLAPLKAKAEKAGWVVRGLGRPSRVLLVAAPSPARSALHAAVASWAAEGLTTRAEAIFEGSDPFGTLAVTAIALDLEPRCARAHVLAGGIRWALAYLKRHHGSYELAAKHQEAALDEQAPYPLDPLERAKGRSSLGTTYLYVAGKDEAAYALLTKAVSDPLLQGVEGLLNIRYNLACATARLRKTDEAFQLLAAVLAENAKQDVDSFEHWREDADFSALHSDPRWAELLKKHPEPE